MEVHIETPFPAAKPSAFTTIGALFFLIKTSDRCDLPQYFSP